MYLQSAVPKAHSYATYISGLLSTNRKIIFGLSLICGTWLLERSLDLKHLLINHGINMDKVILKLQYSDQM